LLALSLVAALASPAGACDSTRARWPNAPGDPLRAWIQPADGSGPGVMTDYDAVRRAFLSWNAVFLPVRFAFTADSAIADVRVRWIARFDRPMSGNTECVLTDDNWILRADVVLAIARFDGRRLDTHEMHGLALHEIGHAIGLVHQPKGVMAATTRVRELTAADRTAARRLYGLP